MLNENYDYHDPQEVPGLSVLTSRVRRFHDCLDEAMERHREEENDELYATAVLEDLAAGCHEMGLPQPFAVRMAGFQSLFGHDADTISTVFKTAYLHSHVKTIPLKYMQRSALLTFKTEAYMKEHYQLRLNVMTGVPEYKQRGAGYSFQPLTKMVRNTMSINALKAGVDSWDRDINRYIDSELIPQYNPITEYLTDLPRWDGRDRITPLAQRVKTDNKHWTHDFHIWMLSMVAQWMGRNRQHGNAIVPLLIGPQGSGKTTFCRRLLPEELQAYYNDRLAMKNDNDIFIAMSSYALINIDEFDVLKKGQQPLLKYLLSKHDIKMRPPYGKVVEIRPRYASFIATTNNRRPLMDNTGSRRFISISADTIDNKGNIAHRQIFAQLVHELHAGKRYWFTDAENKRIMEENMRFQRVDNFVTMVSQTFYSPEDTPANASYMSLPELLLALSEQYPNTNMTHHARVVLGKTLKEMGYNYKKTNRGMAYQLLILPQ